MWITLEAFACCDMERSTWLFSLLEVFTFCEIEKINLAVYQIKDSSTHHIMTWKHTNDNAPTVCILYLHELQHYQALLCKSP